MVGTDLVERARKAILIDGRYDAQELARVGGRAEYMRKEWTPAQLRRMRKRHNRLNKRYPRIFLDELAHYLGTNALFDMKVLDRAAKALAEDPGK
jgi:hypothetical protein